MAVKVGLAGFGSVGKFVAGRLLAGAVPGIELVAVTARDLAKAEASAKSFTPSPRVVPLDILPTICDVVVECATADAFPDIAQAVVARGKHLLCVSAAGFLKTPELEEIARANGGRVQIATGAMPGLDILRSAAEGTIRSVHLSTRIKPNSMAKEPYVLNQGHDFNENPPASAIKIFDGTAREAAANFPHHLNVAVAISLAGIGFDRTTLELWVDPDIPGAIHTLDIDSEEVSLTMISRNLPSVNPKTSRIVGPSVIAALRKLVNPIAVGS